MSSMSGWDDLTDGSMTNLTERRVAWITGAGKGIGRALAKRLTLNGWTVAVSARTENDLASLEAECANGTVHKFPLDVTDVDATTIVVKDIEAKLGNINLAILNAGTYQEVTASHFSREPFQKLIDINLMGAVNGLSEIIPRFMERGFGHIAVVASVAGYRGLPTSAAYGASKAALINMCESLKPELDANDVKLQLINPGFVKTPLTDKNEFPMPFLMSLDDAVERIVAGLKSNTFEIRFPRRLAWILTAFKLIPDTLYFAITRRMSRP